ncbi:aflatoxin B1 aldehyde reductase, partial [Lecanoromycetidae sp. Uapishka_2]
MSHIKILYGTAAFGSLPMETTQGYLDILGKHNVRDLDTANLYQGSEKALGELGAPKTFVIHSKAPGFSKGALNRSSILAGARQTLERLGTNSVETYFLHSPDPDTPIEETVNAIQEVYADGRFKHFGLSNFRPEDVRKIYDYAKSKGFVLPTVFQGNYNPVARHYDTTLFPLLRELKIAFYAYSPLAGGFLVKDAGTLRSGGGRGRWDPKQRVGKLYHDRYSRPSLLDALSEWESIANDAGVSKSALAYRWVSYNSMLKLENGDGIIIGASRHGQLEETLRSIEDGPLDAKIVKRIDGVWDMVKDEAPTDNYHL